MKPNILLIYTGGTIGMMKDQDTGVLKAFDFDKLLVHIPELKQLDCTIDTMSFENPIDSSDMDITQWREIGTIINDNYNSYDGYVVLHGSDTMSYTASALSFMFENLSKPVIFTGSQLPIGDLRTDAKENLITSIQMASICDHNKPVISEVCIYFEYQLYRANRTSKLNAEHFEAFSSPNYPPLAISGVHLNIDKSLLWRGVDKNYALAKAQSQQLKESNNDLCYRSELVPDIAVLRLFPGITRNTVSSICGIKGLRGLILETYGSGNAPTHQWFVDELRAAIDGGVAIVNVTQCKGGAVQMGKYATSVALRDLGIVSGKDMTIEASLVKMMYLLQHTPDFKSFKEYFETSLRGELTA